MKKTKLLKLLLRIFIGLIILVFLLFIAAFIFLKHSQSSSKLLETSETDTVSLVWEPYACGGDCPYYRVLDAGKENNQKYVGKLADIQGYDVWQEFSKMKGVDDNQANDIYGAIFTSDKFVCTGRFKLYSKNLFWQCCMDSDDLAFEAEVCRQIPLSEEEQCRRLQYSFKEMNGREPDLLPQEAEAGDAEAQYLLGIMYEDGWACQPEDLDLARHWYEKSAGQGHQYAGEALERLRKEAEEKARPAENNE